MTVLLGFTSPANKLSFMGSDDIESANATPKDKVALVFGRFLVGGIGDETIFCAIGVLGRLDKNTVFTDGSKYVVPSSVEELCKDVCRVLPIISKHMSEGLDAAIARGDMPPFYGVALKQMNGTLFVIDIQEFKIYFAEFGVLYRVKEFKYKVTELEPEKLLRAGTDTPPKVLNELTPDVISDPFQWCSQKVDEAREEFKHKVPLGKLGMSFLVTPKGVTRQTGLFHSLEDVALKYFPEPRAQTVDSFQGDSDPFEF